MDLQRIHYIAGQIDTGSYIGIIKMQESKHVAVVRVRRSNMGVIKEFHENFPGYYGLKDGRCWISYQGKKAIALLRAVYPFLMNKRGHADIIFDLGASMERCKMNRRKPFEPIPEFEIAIRDGLKNKLQNLNQGKEDADSAPENIFG